MSDPQGDRTLTLNAIRGRGWRVVPIPYRPNRPVVDGWQRLRLDEDEPAGYFAAFAGRAL